MKNSTCPDSTKIPCSNDSCQFPQTCSWNEKCMQKELDLSIAAKKTRQGSLRDSKKRKPTEGKS
ncbi:MAG: hypothetical protein CBC16_02455 [Verrucomicrobia bacterium TMED56]|nr:MAG: hypothetical protein CBC16_02455 [Verrucomicrobia bacterium TMED56]